MKKLVFVLLCLLLVLPLSGCGEKEYVETTLSALKEEWSYMQKWDAELQTEYITMYAVVDDVGPDQFIIREDNYSARCFVKDKKLKDTLAALESECAVLIKGKIQSLGSFSFSPTIIVHELINEGPAISYEKIGESYVVSGIGNFKGTELVIPETYRGLPITAISQEAFKYCYFLQTITIPDSVTGIGKNAFSSCSSLTSVYISDLTAWLNISFANYASNPLNSNGVLYLNETKVTNLVIPDGVTKIRNYAFFGCSSLTSVTIHDNVTSIREGAFYECDSLTSVVIPKSVTSIEAYTFYECDSLTSIVIPDSVTSIGEYAFYGCGLTSVVLPNSVRSIEKSVFQNCTRLTTVVLPASVKYIDDYAFQNCDSLTTVNFSNSLTSIGDYAFEDCDKLTKVVLGTNIKTIGKYAFWSCEKLKSIDYRGTESQSKTIDVGALWKPTLATINYNYTGE